MEKVEVATVAETVAAQVEGVTEEAMVAARVVQVVREGVVKEGPQPHSVDQCRAMQTERRWCRFPRQDAYPFASAPMGACSVYALGHQSLQQLGRREHKCGQCSSWRRAKCYLHRSSAWCTEATTITM